MKVFVQCIHFGFNSGLTTLIHTNAYADCLTNYDNEALDMKYEEEGKEYQINKPKNINIHIPVKSKSRGLNV